MDKLKNKKVITGIAVAVVALIIVLIIVISSAIGGNGTVRANGNLMKNFSAKRIAGKESDSFKKIYNDFYINLFSSLSGTQDNVAIDVPNVMDGVSLLSSGASGETKKLFTKFLGCGSKYAGENLSYIEGKVKYDKDSDVGLASSNNLWFNSNKNIPVKSNFLKRNGKYYGLNVFRENFIGEGIEDVAQDYIVKATNDMVFSDFDLNGSQSMYLFSGATFSSDWKEPIGENSRDENIFDGTVSSVDCNFYRYLSSSYIEGDCYEGISKSLEGGYTFVALKPLPMSAGSNYTIQDIIKELKSKKKYKNLLKLTHRNVDTIVSLPDYTNASSMPSTTDLRTAFEDRGIGVVYDKKAEYKGISSDAKSLFLSKFSASGDISIRASGIGKGYSENKVIDLTDKQLKSAKKYITFNSSFIYFIVNEELNLPVYICILNQLQ